MITYVTGFLGGPHGTAKSARDFLLALLAHESTVFVLAPDTIDPHQSFNDHEESQSTPLWLEKPGLLRLERAGPSNLSAFVRALLMRRRRKTDDRNGPVVVNGWASYGYWMQFADKYSGPRFMIVRESPRHFDFHDVPTTRDQLRKGISEFDGLIFVSERVRDSWLRFPEFHRKQTWVLPNCCEEEEVAELVRTGRALVRQSLGIPKSEFHVVCPGTLELRKGTDLLLDAIPHLSQEIPNLKVRFVGLEQRSQEDFSTRIASTANAEWVGPQPSALQYIYAADLLIFPSRAEALPRTLLEAMLLQTPVVASEVDGVPELVINGETGMLFACDDRGELVTNVLKMASDPELRARLAQAGKHRYRAGFSRQIQRERLGKILSEMAQL